VKLAILKQGFEEQPQGLNGQKQAFENACFPKAIFLQFFKNQCLFATQTAF